MSRRRQQNTPWLHRKSRLIIGAIAVVGAVLTGYLTVVKLAGGEATCPVEGCNTVLTSPWASIFGIPLTIFGILAYTSMAVLALGPLVVKPEVNKELRVKLEEWSWMLLFMGALAMTVFSGYLMYVLATQLQAVCPYCIASAIFSLSLLTVTLLGRNWEDMGQLAFTGVLVAVVTLVGTLGVYSGIDGPRTTPGGALAGEVPPPIETTSGESEIALAQHLTSIGAKKYSAYWCPHCHDQQRLFGEEAFSYIDYVECDPRGQDAQPQLCEAAGVQGFPSWEINGELYSGVRPLNELADLSGYTGPRNFKN
ncbi:MAG: vitamin K epoxide reductase family protein [Synechococcales bacterium]|nr:vitamin K epoxide reductase family protein [Synechococcales bacterium]